MGSVQTLNANLIIFITLVNSTTRRGYHEALVDVVRLLQSFPLALRLLCHLAARKVDKVDLAMPGQLADWSWWFGDSYGGESHNDFSHSDEMLPSRLSQGRQSWSFHAS